MSPRRCFFYGIRGRHDHAGPLTPGHRPAIQLSSMRSPSYYCESCQRGGMDRARWENRQVKVRSAAGVGEQTWANRKRTMSPSERSKRGI